jgi:hypothetical protein
MAVCACLPANISAQTKISPKLGTTSGAVAIPNFSKPVMMFDNATAGISTPSMAIASQAIKLQRERNLQEEMIPMKDKKGLRRVAFMATGNTQTNCTPYADMYFDTKDRWLSTEEFFSLSEGNATELGRLMAKFAAILDAKGYRIGICEEGGNMSLWRISTPVLTWYECEIFKKNIENAALAITLDKEPFRAPNQNIYGTAYFDANGNFVRIQAKSKVKTTAMN